MHRLILAVAIAAATAGCGAGSLLQSPEERRAEISAEVADALSAEKGWQTRFVERRTDAMLADQKVATARVDKMAGRLDALETRVDDVARKAPSVADTGPRGSRTGSSPSRPADAAEISALRRDLDAMTTAVAQLLTERERADAVIRARFERLEHRTSTLPWPPEPGVERGVHLASYKTHEAALRGWEVLLGRYHGLLNKQEPTFAEVDTVAGRYVRLFVGVGLPKKSQVAIRDGIRHGGDYAMILPVPAGPGSEPGS